MNRLSTVAAAALLFSGPAFAADIGYGTHHYLYAYNPPPQGDAIYSGHSMVTGDVSFAGGFYSGNGTTLFGTGGGRAVLDMPSGWMFMLEVSASSANGDLMGYGHVYKRMPGAAVGVYGGVGVFRGLGSITVGVEGTKDLTPHFGIGGDLAYLRRTATSTGFGLANFNAYYWLSPYTRIRGDVDWFGGTSATSGWGMSGSIAHQFNGGPLIGEATAGISRIGTATTDTYYVLVGTTVLFDAPGATLRQHEERGNWRAGLRLRYD